ncbi:LacI family transcriptional regulator [Gordonia spumicola]|uniref:LacI family transcriptional regulator n=1 Tax=Gordonia spumicola TaxID=589161 RepID=A0A7I9V4N7_9ACTN|nr:LacI family DNA-binding transcriptional regulator [Gordonia spumicola]GEE00153.1 LacI family transcriptional regulator [Gordonia spumicola]
MKGQRSRPTIHDVARRAGVSATTVSHTFTGNGTVAARTQEIVRESAAELGYRPDPLARGLRNTRHGVIGLVIRQLHSFDSLLPTGVDYFLRFAGAAALTALEHDYALMLVPDPTGEGRSGDTSLCDGYLIADPVHGDRLTDLIRSQRIPLLTIGYEPGGPTDDALSLDNTTITLDVLDHLAERGARRIAVVLGTDENAWNIDTERAYRDWTARHGQRPIISARAESDGTAGGRNAAGELFDVADDLRPDAVYAMTGRQAAGVMEALADLGLTVPDDVLIACGSDSEHTRTSRPAITSVQLHPHLLASAAVITMINMLEHSDHPVPETDLRPTLEIRGSTARPERPTGERW